MARGATVTVEGINALVRRLAKIDAELIVGLKGVHLQMAQTVIGAAGPGAPRRSGRLAGSLRGGQAARQSIVRAGGASVPYAGPIHWGWPARGIRANPWIAAAAQASEPVWLAQYEQALRALVEN